MSAVLTASHFSKSSLAFDSRHFVDAMYGTHCTKHYSSVWRKGIDFSTHKRVLKLNLLEWIHVWIQKGYVINCSVSPTQSAERVIQDSDVSFPFKFEQAVGRMCWFKIIKSLIDHTTKSLSHAQTKLIQTITTVSVRKYWKRKRRERAMTCTLGDSKCDNNAQFVTSQQCAICDVSFNATSSVYFFINAATRMIVLDERIAARMCLSSTTPSRRQQEALLWSHLTPKQNVFNIFSATNCSVLSFWRLAANYFLIESLGCLVLARTGSDCLFCGFRTEHVCWARSDGCLCESRTHCKCRQKYTRNAVHQNRSRVDVLNKKVRIDERTPQSQCPGLVTVGCTKSMIWNDLWFRFFSEKASAITALQVDLSIAIVQRHWLMVNCAEQKHNGSDDWAAGDATNVLHFCREEQVNWTLYCQDNRQPNVSSVKYSRQNGSSVNVQQNEQRVVCNTRHENWASRPQFAPGYILSTHVEAANSIVHVETHISWFILR